MTVTPSLPQPLHGRSNGLPRDLQQREQVWFIVNRAYQNIYGMNMPKAAEYQKTIFEAALAMHKDPRSHAFSDRMFLKVCEDIIRISDEHTRLANKHKSRASNPVYLRETALDNASEKQKYLHAIGASQPDSTVIHAGSSAGRIERAKSDDNISSSKMMDMAYQQLSETLKSKRN